MPRPFRRLLRRHFILAFALIGASECAQAIIGGRGPFNDVARGRLSDSGDRPVAFGWLRDLATGWTVPMMNLLAVVIIQAIADFGAGRGRP
jgi:hypothetical protein